ncbi:hypothetical protein [Aeromonas jandaei]|uniref:hypothetical protein n=1 Tax=Aeromonas jandaei TaxID=650 RepID=UPI003BA293BE
MVAELFITRLRGWQQIITLAGFVWFLITFCCLFIALWSTVNPVILTLFRVTLSSCDNHCRCLCGKAELIIWLLFVALLAGADAASQYIGNNQPAVFLWLRRWGGVFTEKEKQAGGEGVSPPVAGVNESV